ncbi:MAG: cation:dicarboxylase symporter family transporter [Vicinamibacterales bacterium]
MGLSDTRRSYSSTGWVLAGFAAGIVLGLAARVGPSWLATVIDGAEVAGAIFVNAIRMTVVPLVVGMLVAGLGSAQGSKVLSGLGARSIALIMLPVSAAMIAMLVGAPLLAWIPIDATAATELRQGAMAGAPVTAPAVGLGTWLIDLVPANAIKAAADGSVLPLIVFTILFGLAVGRLDDERRRALTTFFGALADAMLVVVRWVVSLAPIGVMALSAPLAARMGVSVAGLLANYVAVAVILTLVVLAVIVYPATAIVGRVSMARFARACLPAQALALSSRSTMATLPAMIDAAKSLDVPAASVALVIPLAATTLRVGAAVGQMVAVLFAARLFDVSLSTAQLGSVLITTILMSVASPGVPGGSIIVMTPVLAAAGIPPGAIGILLGADAIPDMVRTLANVTGGIAAAVIAGRVIAPET